MNAFDSRRTPDPAQQLRPETIETLRQALIDQGPATTEPSAELRAAVQLAAREGRERQLPAEVVLIQLKALADQIGLTPIGSVRSPERLLREWMVTACLHAYWEAEADA